MARSASKKPVPIAVMEGQDWLVLDELVRQAVDRNGGPEVCESHRFDVSTDGLSTALECARSPSLFSTSTVVSVTNLEKIDEGGLKSLEGYIARPEPDVTFIVQLQAGRSLKKPLKDVLKEMPRVDVKRARARAIERGIQWTAKEFEVEFEPKAVAALKQIFTAQTGACHAELEKLALYAGKGGKITQEACRQLIASKTEEAVWAIGDAVGSRDAAAALRVLHDLLAQGEEPLFVLGMLQSLYRRLWAVKQAEVKGVPLEDCARALNMKPYPLKKAVQQSKRTSLEAIEEALRRLAKADEDLKGGSRWTELVLERLAVGLATI